jgi:hypothetical protein
VITHAVDMVIKGGWVARCGCFLDTPERISDNPTCRECGTVLHALPLCVCGHRWSQHGQDCDLCGCTHYAAHIDGHVDG